jgi:hypothetical protein
VIYDIPIGTNWGYCHIGSLGRKLRVKPPTIYNQWGDTPASILEVDPAKHLLLKPLTPLNHMRRCDEIREPVIRFLRGHSDEKSSRAWAKNPGVSLVADKNDAAASGIGDVHGNDSWVTDCRSLAGIFRIEQGSPDDLSEVKGGLFGNKVFLSADSGDPTYRRLMPGGWLT